MAATIAVPLEPPEQNYLLVLGSKMHTFYTIFTQVAKGWTRLPTPSNSPRNFSVQKYLVCVTFLEFWKDFFTSGNFQVAKTFLKNQHGQFEKSYMYPWLYERN